MQIIWDNHTKCLYEKGGMGLKYGQSQIICDKKGKKKGAINLIEKYGFATIPIKKGDHVIIATCDSQEKNLIVTIHKIVSISDCINCEIINNFIHNTWIKSLNPFFEEAVKAVIKKATSIHTQLVYVKGVEYL